MRDSRLPADAGDRGLPSVVAETRRKGKGAERPWRKVLVFAALQSLSAMMMLLTSPAAADEPAVFMREDFADLDRWKPLTFPKIERHSTYTAEKQEGVTFLKAVSDNSASGIVFADTFSVYEYPRIRWRWKVERVYAAGNARVKSGDDYPARLYVIFPFDPERAGFGDKIKYQAARVLYGDYPPQSALNYIWANKEHEARIIPNAYTGKAQMIVMRGPDEAGTWQTEEADILRDYREAFGGPPPPRASLAVMNDSDDTGASSQSYIDYIEIFR